MIKITVTGAPGSGTRLLTRILDASPDIEAFHDGTHGKEPIETILVMVIVRDPEAVEASYQAKFSKGRHKIPTPEKSRKLIAKKYPHAFLVRYEGLVENPDAIISRIADSYGVEPWPCPEVIYDGNVK